MRLIDADALKAEWYKINDIGPEDCGARFVGYSEIARLIDNAPTVEPGGDYISRAHAIDALSRSSVYAWSTEQDLVAHSWAIRILQSLPSANAKQGKWLTDKGKSLMICSVCGTLFNKHTDFFDFEEFANFCPYCGAIMKGGDDE